MDPKPQFQSSPQESLLPEGPAPDPGPVPASEREKSALTDALTQLGIILSESPAFALDLNDLRIRAQVAALDHPSWHWVALLAWTARAAIQELQALAISEPGQSALNPHNFPLTAWIPAGQPGSSNPETGNRGQGESKPPSSPASLSPVLQEGAPSSEAARLD